VALSNSHINALLKVVRKITEGGEKFVVKIHHDIHSLWERAAEYLPGICCHSPFHKLNYLQSYSSKNSLFLSPSLTKIEHSTFGTSRFGNGL